VVFNASLFYGTTRFLALALPALAVLAAVGIAAAVSLVASRLTGRPATQQDEDQAATVRPLAGAAMVESAAATSSPGGNETPA
jgi:negative regulator of sigma E activity